MSYLQASLQNILIDCHYSISDPFFQLLYRLTNLTHKKLHFWKTVLCRISVKNLQALQTVCCFCKTTLYHGILLAWPAVLVPKWTDELFWLFALCQHKVCASYCIWHVILAVTFEILAAVLLKIRDFRCVTLNCRTDTNSSQHFRGLWCLPIHVRHFK
jgi:hypothetical protein